MILNRGRFILVAGFVAFAAFLSGFGALLTGAQPAARPAIDSPPVTPRHSGDDGGFSVTLTEPSEAYLVGIKKIVIEPRVPPGDTMVGADFFVDGRLVATDRKPPYSTEIDFGQQIKRHTIIVTALTAGGRRAKVSFVSRAADLAGSTVTPIAFVPAVVRDAGGRFVDGLSVGDFVLLQDGARQSIVHLDDDPVPQSIAVLVQAAAPDEARRALLRGAGSFADTVLSFDSLGLVPVGQLLPAQVAVRAGTVRASKKAGDPAGTAALPPLPAADFSFDRGMFGQDLAELHDGPPEKPPLAALPESLQIAVRGLLTRPRGRVVVLLLAAPLPVEAEAALLPAAGTEAKAVPARGDDGVDQELAAALEALKKAAVTLHVVVYGDTGPSSFPLIRKAAEDSGGEFVVAANADAVDAGCRRLSESLRHQYLVGFAPAAAEHEGWRTIEVRLRPPGLTVQARRSYFATPPPKRP